MRDDSSIKLPKKYFYLTKRNHALELRLQIMIIPYVYMEQWSFPVEKTSYCSTWPFLSKHRILLLPVFFLFGNIKCIFSFNSMIRVRFIGSSKQSPKPVHIIHWNVLMQYNSSCVKEHDHGEVTICYRNNTMKIACFCFFLYC